MMGATLYMSGLDAKTEEHLDDTNSCSMCRRLIINAGIEKTVCRSSGGKITVIHIRDWVFNDDSILDGSKFSLT
jgi:dCMP deaminase